MTEKDLRKLNRKQLLELLLKQTQRADELQKQLEELQEELENRQALESEAGSIKEAAERLSDVVEAAQAAFDNVGVIGQKPFISEAAEPLYTKDPLRRARITTALESNRKIQEAENKRKAEDILADLEACRSALNTNK